MSLQGKVETELTACTKGCATCNSSRKKRLLGEVLKAAAKVAGCEEVVKLIVKGGVEAGAKIGVYVVTATVEHVITNPESASEAVLQGVKMATELCTC